MNVRGYQSFVGHLIGYICVSTLLVYYVIGEGAGLSDL